MGLGCFVDMRLGGWTVRPRANDRRECGHIDAIRIHGGEKVLNATLAWVKVHVKVDDHRKPSLAISV
jgi:hypothetical protein